MALAAVAVLAACAATQPVTPKLTYLLEAERSGAAVPAARPGSLSVGAFLVAEAFAGKSMVYRFDEYRYESDFYHQYFVSPREMITQRVFEWMQRAGLYESVRLAAGARPPHGGVTLEGLVTRLYCDLRDPQSPVAVLAIQFYLVSDRGQVLFATELRNVQPMADASADALARASSEALAAILTELETRLQALPLTTTAPAESPESPASAPAQ